MEVVLKIYKMPDPSLQSYLDKWIATRPDIGATEIPTEFCDINRNPGGTMAPWAAFVAPTDGAVISGTTLNVNFNAFSAQADVTSAELYFDGTLLDTVTSLPHSDSYNIGDVAVGNHTLSVKVTDSAGNNGTTSITLEKLGTTSIDSPANGAILAGGSNNQVNFTYTGVQLNNIQLIVNGTASGATCTASSCTWATPATPGSYSLVVRGVRKGVTINSNTITVTVI
ncbi:MAG: hypothetical protein TR69_WS6001000533 [candidate division WS6 bacterium OLB20]|uniref:Bacterial Ig-like domain-containing protein n=1 Tax=candidate division WS6 bacterium OLB20 TaxID=1617426 RepID=A0A136LXY9_9BACT|nr:MAG: hypothetical protein TR69_WS6001000533 [candidate division WS6 bacterium OLB20]